jgi:hypothetical protein
MKYFEFIPRRANGLAAILLLLLVCSCNPASVIPDTRALAPPLCSHTTGTAHVSLSLNPASPSLRMAQITRVEWEFWRRCATDIPTDPAQGIGGRQTYNCSIQQELGGSLVGEYCATGSQVLGAPPAEWHVEGQTFEPSRSNINFDFFGEVQGNVCVRLTAHLSDGTTPPPVTRLWRVQLDAPGITIPSIGFFMGIDAAGVDPTFSQLSSSTPDCPLT